MRNVLKFDGCCLERDEIVGVNDDVGESNKTRILLRGGGSVFTRDGYDDVCMRVFGTAEETMAEGLKRPAEGS